MLLDFKPASVLATDLTRALERQIIFGDLPGGMRLTEEIVCKHSGISRSPVREALHALEKSGLLVREPRRGVHIPQLSVGELDDLYTCRRVLERLVAELATKNATRQEIASIEGYQRECQAYLMTGDIRGHFEANLAMSAALLQATHSPTIVRTVAALSKVAARYRFQVYDSHRFRAYSAAAGEHLVRALLQRDAPAVSSTVERILVTAWRLIRSRLSKAEKARSADISENDQAEAQIAAASVFTTSTRALI